MIVFNAGVQTDESELSSTESTSRMVMSDSSESPTSSYFIENQNCTAKHHEHGYHPYRRQAFTNSTTFSRAYIPEKMNSFFEDADEEIIYDNAYLICDAMWSNQSAYYSDCEMETLMAKIRLDENCYHSEVDSGVNSSSQSSDQPSHAIAAVTSHEMPLHFEVQSNPPSNPTSPALDGAKRCYRRAVPRMGTQVQRNMRTAPTHISLNKDSTSQLQIRERGTSPPARRCQSSARCVDIPPNIATTLKAPVQLVGASMEWVLKKRADGTRYVTRRPARNRMPNEHARQVVTERDTIYTDEATIFNQRKRHLRKQAAPTSASRVGPASRPGYLPVISQTVSSSSTSSSDSSKARVSPASLTYHCHKQRSTTVQRSAVCFCD